MTRLLRLGWALNAVVALVAVGCGTGLSSTPVASEASSLAPSVPPSLVSGALATTIPIASMATVGGTWTTAAPLPSARSEIAAAVVDGRLYVAGGFGEPRAVMLDELVVYDPVADAWTKLAPLPEPRHHAALTAIGDRLILTGGGVEGFAPRANTWAYDPSTDAWTELAPMPAPRRAHAAVAVDGILYVVGGVVDGMTLRAPTWAFDPASGEWRTELAELPTYREHLAAVAVDGGLLAIGGRGTQSVDAVERYDPATNSWAAMAPLPAARGGLAAARLGDAIHVVGGESVDPPKIFGDHEVLDLETGEWALAPPMERGRHGLGAGIIDGRLYAAGGGPNPDLSTSDRVDVFEP